MGLIDRNALMRTICGIWCECEPDECRFMDERINCKIHECVENAPTVDAVPLDKLCEFLAGIYGSPCQLGEIECYPQCEPDENGECYGMRTDDKRCWHDYLTKWMEGWHDHG